jgi:SAM-dependent methyltransferase
MSSAKPRPCPVCGATDTVVVGPILHPQPTLVAGVELDLGDSDYKLIRCPHCCFMYKDPPIDAAKLMACYAAANRDNWALEPDPCGRKFDVLRGLLESYCQGRRALDVGCFNGALLSYLGDGWQKFGVEPSRAAAALAKQRGVEILAPSLDLLDANGEKFDAIMAIDVVEHIVEPLPFFRAVSERLAPGGVFLVSTGNTDALAWRLQNSMYWYCSLPEHVSFYNRSSLDRLAMKLGLTRVEYRPLRPRRLSSVRLLSDGFKNFIYVIGRAFDGFGIRPLRRLVVERRGPSVQTAKDHLIYVFRKPA